MGKYEELLQELAHHKKRDDIICGHIHTPEDKQVGGIHCGMDPPAFRC